MINVSFFNEYFMLKFELKKYVFFILNLNRKSNLLIN